MNYASKLLATKLIIIQQVKAKWNLENLKVLQWRKKFKKIRIIFIRKIIIIIKGVKLFFFDF